VTYKKYEVQAINSDKGYKAFFSVGNDMESNVRVCASDLWSDHKNKIG